MRIWGKEIRWAIATGVLTGLSWAPVGFWLAAFLGPAAFLLFMARASSALDQHHRFILFLLFMLSTWALPLHWVALHPIPVTAFTSVFALLAYAMIFAAALSTLPGWLERRGMSGTLLPMILVWSAFDWGLGQTPFAMPWLRLGMATAPSDWSLFWVAIVGPIGLTLLMLSSAGVFEAIRQTSQFRWAVLAAFLLMILLPSFVSTLRSGNTSNASNDLFERSVAELELVLVQPGWSPETWADIDNPERLDQLGDLLSGYSGSPDAVIFPETSLPPLTQLDATTALNRLSEIAGAPVVSGGILKQGDEGDGSAWNAAFSTTSTYRKRRLVPFAEYVPFSSAIPFFSAFSVPSGGVEAYVPGGSMELIQVGSASAGVLICFESLFLRDGRSYALSSADLLIVLTQDGWWQSGAARAQHVSFTRLLAAASGLPVVQVSVDGQSALINAHGNIVLDLPGGGPFVITGHLPLSAATTPYRALGDWTFCLSFLLLAGWGFASPIIRGRSTNLGTGKRSPYSTPSRST